MEMESAITKCYRTHISSVQTNADNSEKRFFPFIPSSALKEKSINRFHLESEPNVKRCLYYNFGRETGKLSFISHENPLNIFLSR